MQGIGAVKMLSLELFVFVFALQIAVVHRERVNLSTCQIKTSVWHLSWDAHCWGIAGSLSVAASLKQECWRSPEDLMAALIIDFLLIARSAGLSGPNTEPHVNSVLVARGRTQTLMCLSVCSCCVFWQRRAVSAAIPCWFSTPKRSAYWLMMDRKAARYWQRGPFGRMWSCPCHPRTQQRC